MATDHALLPSRQQKAWYVPAFKSPGKEVVPIHPGGKVIAVKKLLLSATQFLFDRTGCFTIANCTKPRFSGANVSLELDCELRAGSRTRERVRKILKKNRYVENVSLKIEKF